MKTSSKSKLWGVALLLATGAAGCSGTASPQASADAMRRLEMRVTALEGNGTQAPPRAEASRLPHGPAALRVASLRAAADFLERAELARRGGDTGRAGALFQSAVDEVGADVLVDFEPLFKIRTAVQENAPKPAAAPESPAPAPPASAPGPPEPAASTKAAPSHPRERERDRASLSVWKVRSRARAGWGSCCSHRSADGEPRGPPMPRSSSATKNSFRTCSRSPLARR